MKKELLKQLYLIKKTRNSARDVLTYIFGIVFFSDTFKNRTYPHIKKGSTAGLRDLGRPHLIVVVNPYKYSIFQKLLLFSKH